MNVLMLTNTYEPHVGGVARSVHSFAAELRQRGDRVLVVAPSFNGSASSDDGVLRVPAVQNFNGTDFSVPVAIPGTLTRRLREFEPQIVHSHHPFLLGDTALRVAVRFGLPVVFTHHTFYEQYTHYVPLHLKKLGRIAVDLVTGYCNLCDAVIAPSETVAAELPRRGVVVPIHVIPTGVDVARFGGGDRVGFRRRSNIAADAEVIGYAGRLAPEKNLDFLTSAAIRLLEQRPSAIFLVVGGGPSEEEMRARFAENGLGNRVVFTGVLGWDVLPSAYAAMDLFAFSSASETQGMVLTEAMAAGVPVVAIEASGVREVVRDGVNGRIVRRTDVVEFVAAVEGVLAASAERKRAMREAARRTSLFFSKEAAAARLAAVYEELIAAGPRGKEIESSVWSTARARVETNVKIVGNIARAFGDGVLSLPDKWRL